APAKNTGARLAPCDVSAGVDSSVRWRPERRANILGLLEQQRRSVTQQSLRTGVAPGDGAEVEAFGMRGLQVAHFVADAQDFVRRGLTACEQAAQALLLAEQGGAAMQLREQRAQLRAE